MNERAKRAAIYARSATSQELGQNFAVDAQIRACIQHANEQGYEVVDGQIYREIGSGNSANRQLLLAVLAAAEEGLFDVLLVYDFARLARDVKLLTELIKRFEEAGVKVESVTEDTELSTMIAAIYEKVGEVQKSRVAARSKAGKQAKRASN